MMIHIYKIGIAVIRDNCLLLCKPYAFDDLILPGGIKEGNESAVENLRREIKEELGDDATLDEPSLRYLANFTDRAAGKTDRVVEIELYTGNVTGPLHASSEIKELVWFSPFEAVEHKLSEIVERKVIPYLVANKFLREPQKD